MASAGPENWPLGLLPFQTEEVFNIVLLGGFPYLFALYSQNMLAKKKVGK